MKIIFPINLYQKLRAYVESINYEISGFGKIELIDKTDILVKDIKIFRQEVTLSDTVIDKNDLAKFYDELIKNGEDLRCWKMWWHSHCQTPAFWSGVDIQTIEDFDNEMPQDNWMLSLVTNHNNQMVFRADVFAPIRCTIHKIDWEIKFDQDQQLELNDKILDEITKKVEIFVPKSRKIFKKRNMTVWDVRTSPFELPEEVLKKLTSGDNPISNRD